MPSLEKETKQVSQSLADLEGRVAPQDAAGCGFVDGAASPPDKPSRRHFLKLMAAGAGLAGLTSCRWPKENILPYAHRPAEIVPGNPLYFATSMDVAGRAQGLVVTSYDGRPIKVDGNPLHPNNRGGSNAQSQSSILDLYDPDRSKSPVQLVDRQSLDQPWETLDGFAQDHFSQMRGAQGKGLCVLAEASSSPSIKDMRERFAKVYPQARWHEYEPINRDNERAGSALALGGCYRTQHRFDQAAVVVSLDSDFLVDHPAALAYAREFMAAHTPTSDKSPGMSRLYVVESTYSNTGAMADNHLVTPKGAVLHVAAALGAALVDAGLLRDILQPDLVAAMRRHAGTQAPSPFVGAAARDLMANRGKSIVIAGPQQPAEVHALAHTLNFALGNVGQTVWFTEDPEGIRPSHVQAITELVTDMRARRVQTLLILGGNPIYNAPADLDFAAALALVPMSIHLSLYWDETSQRCTWHVPRAHYLEAWGDTRAYDGTYAPAQPLIAPLYEGRSAIELLSQISERPGLSGYEIVRRTVRSRHAASMTDEQFERFWRKLLNDGVLEGTGYGPRVTGDGAQRADGRDTGGQAAGGARQNDTWSVNEHGPAAAQDPGTLAGGTQPGIQVPELRSQIHAIEAALKRVQLRAPLGPQNLEIVLREDTKVYDGRFANNGWLQELPEIMTKITWGNAVLMGPATAKELGLAEGQVVELLRAGERIVGPVDILPGQAEYSLTVSLGYGRKAAGNVGNDVGFDAYPLRMSGAMHFADGVTVRPTGKVYPLAITQERWNLDKVGQQGAKARLEDIVSEMTLAEYEKLPIEWREGAQGEKPEQLWPPFEYNGYKWGMAIDMQKCIGCNACTIACQAENNSVIVGADQVRRRREMHWLRIDRYFRGEAADPQVSFQPIFCVHCENAPCESVCPVAATLHDQDGLNLMVYNRCVGTRYCSNNCPYKVRRFNFYHYSLGLPPVRQMQMNPDVTVRSRGVMEKCTYCVQRIERAKIAAKNERRGIKDGEFTTACSQACPTGAIVFGDLNDKTSRVAQLHRDKRSYAVLAELNTRPRSLHMARVRNPGVATAEEEMRRRGDKEQRPRQG